MLTFVQFLEELADSKKTISIPAGEVSRLVDRFGDRVRLRADGTRAPTAVSMSRSAPSGKPQQNLETIL
jgi:hypothetical protein